MEHLNVLRLRLAEVATRLVNRSQRLRWVRVWRRRSPAMPRTAAAAAPFPPPPRSSRVLSALWEGVSGTLAGPLAVCKLIDPVSASQTPILPPPPPAV